MNQHVFFVVIPSVCIRS